MKRYINIIVKTTLVATTLLAMGACENSDELVTPRSYKSDKITYGVSTEGMSRAAETYDGNTTLNNFWVASTYTLAAEYGTEKADDGFSPRYENDGNNAIYFKFTQFTRPADQTNASWTSESTYKWPSDEATQLNFYALSNVSEENINNNITYDSTNGVPSLVYTLPTSTTDESCDLMVATKRTQTRPDYGDDGSQLSHVNLKFRHALAKMRISVDVRNDDVMQVVIDKVTLHNFRGRGTMTFPTGDTDAGSVSASGLMNVPANNATWTYSDDDKAQRIDHVFTFDSAHKELSKGALHTADSITYSDVNFLLPELYSSNADYYWKPSVDNCPATSSTKAYISIQCQVYQTTTTLNGEKTRLVIWNGSETKLLYMAGWLPIYNGMKYTLQLHFSNSGNSEDLRDGDNNHVMPKIRFDWTTDDWVEGTTFNTEL